MRIVEHGGDMLVQVSTIRDRATRLYVERFGRHVRWQCGWRSLSRSRWDHRPGVDQTSTRKPFAQRKAEARPPASHCVECGHEMDKVEAEYSLTCGRCRKVAYLPVRDLNRKGTDQKARPR